MALLKKKKEQYPWLSHYPAMVDWRAEIPVKPVYRIIDEAAEKFPHHICVDFLGKKLTYAQMAALVNKAVKGLQGIGVRKGTKVGLYLPNCPQFIIFYYAILKAGGTVVNYNPLYAFREIKHQVEDSGTTILITLNLKDLFNKATSLLNSTTLEHIIVTGLDEYLPFPKNLLFSFVKRNDIANVSYSRVILSARGILENDGKYVEETIEPEKDIAVLQYTGGTTGIPKGAMLTHANIYANMAQSRFWFANLKDGEECMLAALPFFHVFAMTAIMNLGLHIGARIVLHPRFVLKDVMQDIEKKKVTILAGVPTMFNAIIHSPLARKHSLRSLNACVSGGASLPKEIKESFEQLSHCSLVEGYGLTESSPVACVNPLAFHNIKTPKKAVEQKNIAAQIGSVGLPLPRTIITIRDKDNHKKILPIGEIGELCIEGPQVMLGYYNKPEETAQVLVNGVLRTGDLACMDKHGFTYVVDRLKEVIITGGFNVYPRNVEEALYQHPAIEEAAVVGEPDNHKGQIVAAYVKLKEERQTGVEELITFLKGFLAPFEIPSQIYFVESLPKTLIGKISKKDIIKEK